MWKLQPRWHVRMVFCVLQERQARETKVEDCLRSYVNENRNLECGAGHSNLEHRWIVRTLNFVQKLMDGPWEMFWAKVLRNFQLLLATLFTWSNLRDFQEKAHLEVLAFYSSSFSTLDDFLSLWTVLTVTNCFKSSSDVFFFLPRHRRRVFIYVCRE